MLQFDHNNKAQKVQSEIQVILQVAREAGMALLLKTLEEGGTTVVEIKGKYYKLTVQQLHTVAAAEVPE